GNVQGGQATPDTRDIYPIPSSEILANPNLVQNDGY
ncbi:MAG: RagB/SusD family nutrient uptake outer membrane protein, partial [Gemmatimonadetes bacterium]|nr:RagB/SusD family nutrient uptake outer membrane protein [Gemmatimonadota bacterium]